MKKKAKPSEYIAVPMSEDDYIKHVWETDDAIENEQRANWFAEIKQLNKKQLIELLSEAREREDNLWGELIRRNGHIANFKSKIKVLKIERDNKLKNQKKGRNAQAIQKVAETSHGQALGVNDFYGLIRMAIVQLQTDPKLKENHLVGAKAIREIIVDMLVKSDLSRHTYDRSQWIKIVERNIKSSHIGTAKTQLKKNIEPTTLE